MAFTHVYRSMEIAPRSFIPYKPKSPKPRPPKSLKALNHDRPVPSAGPFARQPSSINTFRRMDFSEISAEVLARENNGLEKNGSNCEAAVQDVIDSGDNLDSGRGAGLTEHTNAPAAMNNFDDSDNEFPPLHRLLSPDYRHKLVEEGTLVPERAAEKDIDEALDDLLGYKKTAGSSQDDPFLLESDNMSEDADENCHTTAYDEQSSHEALDLEVLPMPLKRFADQLDGDDDIGKNASTPAKRRAGSATPLCETNLYHAGTPALPHDEDVVENADGDDYESGDEEFWSKRRKLSDSLGGRAALSSQGESRNSPSLIAKDVKGCESESTTVKSNLVNSAGTLPDVSQSAPLAEPQLGPAVIDANQEWEIRKIIGREDVDGVRHYLVEWSSTLEPKHSLPKELVDEFEARLQALRGAKGKRRGLGVNNKAAALEAGAADGQQQKRPRGRPRKQR